MNAPTEPWPLCRLLLSHAARATAEQLVVGEALEELSATRLREARAALPDLRVDDETFLAYLAARLPAHEPLKALAAVQAADLLLACACARGDADAIAEAEHRLLPRIARTLRRAASNQDGVEDLTQLLRVKLFVREAERPPRISEYSGRGPLVSWLSATATRLAIDLKRTDKASVSLDDGLAESLPLGGDGAEVRLVRGQAQQELQQALRTALAELSARDRTLLRFQHVDQLSFDQIGAFYRVHKSTVCRWLAAAREQVLRRSQALLSERLNLNPSELHSLMRVAHSQLNLSVITCLREATDLDATPQPKP
ncbi:MAG: sigma-70 family RNA polymerase sigma factor [Deltaproteobacteria bacterium]|nr:sigma-70 family RNA polymerase sigma factor [Deltaproteobacteria bacterium]